MCLVLMRDGRPCRSAAGATAEPGLKALAVRLACQKTTGTLEFWWTPSGKLMARPATGPSRFTGLELITVPALPGTPPPR
ncbi:hypothetical protein [Streptomyces sp. NPDC096030]|uniref:hypothetical protein n=1 Tax=Streptomyces sp. NPDC096030 TaxID=3155423 RepID=UPI00332304BC